MGEWRRFGMRTFLLCNDSNGKSTGLLSAVSIEGLIHLINDVNNPLVEYEIEEEKGYFWCYSRKFFINHFENNQNDPRWIESIMPTKYMVKLLRLLKRKNWNVVTISPDFYPFWRLDEKGMGVTSRVMDELRMKLAKKNVENDNNNGENIKNNVQKATNTRKIKKTGF
jgi:hypothetical protein